MENSLSSSCERQKSHLLDKTLDAKEKCYWWMALYVSIGAEEKCKNQLFTVADRAVLVVGAKLSHKVHESKKREVPSQWPF